MIDYVKSAKLNNCAVDKLKLQFKKYPGSGKKIIRICDGCGEEREIYFYAYRDLCVKCANSTLEHCAENSARQIQYYIDNPKAGKSHSEWLIQYHKDHPEIGVEHGEKLRNSDAMKAEHERQRDGNDTIEHHYIYDHANSEKYTMKVIRSKHTHIHWWMYKSEIKVPHINVTENNKDIFKGRKSQ